MSDGRKFRCPECGGLAFIRTAATFAWCYDHPLPVRMTCPDPLWVVMRGE